MKKVERAIFLSSGSSFLFSVVLQVVAIFLNNNIKGSRAKYDCIGKLKR